MDQPAGSEQEEESGVSNVVPIGAPSHGECWKRMRLVESILEHRTLLPESTRQELLRVLRGESVTVPKEAG